MTKHTLFMEEDDLHVFIKQPLLLLCLVLLFGAIFRLKRAAKQKVLLVDFACYKPPLSQSLTKAEAASVLRNNCSLSEQSADFSRRTMDISGMGDSAYLPRSILMNPPNICISESRMEAESAIFTAMAELLVKTGVRGNDIGILVVNCSIFCPVPSLSSMIVNRLKLRDDIASYILHGMGCSAGLSAIGLAKHLLQVHPNTNALVVSTENLTENCYQGDDRSMLLINCVFRVGGAAILLSNRPSDRRAAKYELIHTVHTHTASSDGSYGCIFQQEDDRGLRGVAVTRQLLEVATHAIQTNFAALGWLVLPMSELLRFALNYLVRCFCGKNVRPYVPNFNKVIDHVLPHVGGKPVLDALQKSLKLTDVQMEPSRMTLYRFGNTSSSSIWYEMAYTEAKERVKKGDRVLQIAFGSGFKCSSAVWRALKTIERDEKNPWSDEINEFPVLKIRMGPLFKYFEE